MSGRDGRSAFEKLGEAVDDLCSEIWQPIERALMPFVEALAKLIEKLTAMRADK